MNMKIVLFVALTLVILGVPSSFARPQYLNAEYGVTSCGNCHVDSSGGGQLNAFGILFSDQPNHATDPAVALKAMGASLMAKQPTGPHSQYISSLIAEYGVTSCGTCHVDPNGGGPRNAFGTSFENQPNHATDPAAALKAIMVSLTANQPTGPHRQYISSLYAEYGVSTCGTCHVDPNGGDQLTSFGILFQNQSNHATDPAAALKAISASLILAKNQPTATPAVTATATPMPPIATATPVPPIATATPAAPGFGIGLSLIGLFAWSFLAKRKNK